MWKKVPRNIKFIISDSPMALAVTNWYPDLELSSDPCSIFYIISVKKKKKNFVFANKSMNCM